MNLQWTSLLLLIFPIWSHAAGQCPFSNEACARLEAIGCKLEQKTWSCSDDDSLEYDHGAKRTQQIRTLAHLIGELPDHPSLASLRFELGQIRLTGYWVADKAFVSIKRRARTTVEVRYSWFSHGSVNVPPISMSSTFKDGTLAWGEGRYAEGFLEMDKRQAAGWGAVIRMASKRIDEAEIKIEFDNSGRGGIQYSATMTRLEEGPWALAPTGFQKNIRDHMLMGQWLGTVIESCPGKPDKNKVLRLGLHWSLSGLTFKQEIQDSDGSYKVEYWKEWPALLYQLMDSPSEGLVRRANENTVEMISESSQFSSSWIKRVKKTGLGNDVSYFESTKGGFSPTCTTQGILKPL